MTAPKRTYSWEGILVKFTYRIRIRAIARDAKLISSLPMPRM
jgi:hypothetical protein